MKKLSSDAKTYRRLAMTFYRWYLCLLTGNKVTPKDLKSIPERVDAGFDYLMKGEQKCDHRKRKSKEPLRY
jgi:hypothetical protein